MSSFPPIAGVVREIRVAPDQTLLEGAALLTVDVAEDQSDVAASTQAIDPDHVRPTWPNCSNGAR